MGADLTLNGKLLLRSCILPFYVIGIFLTVDSVRFGFREADKRNGYVSGGYLSDQFLAMLENYFKENELESDTLI